MKSKRFVKTLALLLVTFFLGAASARAQVFIMTDEDNSNRTPAVSPSTPLIPTQDITQDQSAPIDGGLLLLCGMGLTFALCKNKKED